MGRRELAQISVVSHGEDDERAAVTAVVQPAEVLGKAVEQTVSQGTDSRQCVQAQPQHLGIQVAHGELPSSVAVA
ncbi:MAG: hypothetical protein M3R01_00045, partial [Actinomycetota bacterium]|nr:hypothetical protein [Actinomycetota bacterium]